VELMKTRTMRESAAGFDVLSDLGVGVRVSTPVAADASPDPFAPVARAFPGWSFGLVHLLHTEHLAKRCPCSNRIENRTLGGRLSFLDQLRLSER
jgi:hypothetical protein